MATEAPRGKATRAFRTSEAMFPTVIQPAEFQQIVAMKRLALPVQPGTTLRTAVQLKFGAPSAAAAMGIAIKGACTAKESSVAARETACTPAALHATAATRLAALTPSSAAGGSDGASPEMYEAKSTG